MEAQDKENLEKIFDGLATEANQASAELDEINVEIQGVKRGTERSTRSPHAIEHKRVGWINYLKKNFATRQRDGSDNRFSRRFIR